MVPLRPSKLFTWVVAASLGAALQAAPLPPSTAWEEVVDPDEPAIHQKFADDINKIQEDTAREDGMPLARGFHIKSHAILKGTFRVLGDLPAPAAQGVFAQPGTYDAWVRFSNLKPQRQPDSNPDFRAMAVKVLDVPGTPLTPGATSLDIMGLNKVLQPARNIKQFIAFVLASFDLKTFPFKLARAIGVREAFRMINWMRRNLKAEVTSLARQPYWSTIPVAWGDYAVKYKFVPHASNGGPGNPDREAPNFLRDEFALRLKRRPLRWDLYVQFYTDPENTPIEDAVVVWDPEVTPLVKVGVLELAARDVTSPEGRAEEAYGDRLLWNSWHAPEAHRPLGGLQRARRVAYPASGRKRGMVQPGAGR